MQYEKWIAVDLLNPPQKVYDLGPILYTGDENSLRLGVTVTKDKAPVTLTGNVEGYVIIPDGSTLPTITGDKAENRAWIDLPDEAMVLTGRISIALRIVGTSETTVVVGASASVRRTGTGQEYDPNSVVPTWDAVLVKIGQMNAATTAANTAATNAAAAALAGVRTDTNAQGLNDTQKANARTNIDAADVGTVSQIEGVVENVARAVNSDAENVDLDVSDEDGNVILRLADGHIQTKEFSSRLTPVRSSGSDASADLDVADINGNVVLRIADGHIRTKAFDSAMARQLSGKKWAVIGDSLTEHNSRATMNYHDYVAQDTGITVINLGKSGRGYAAGYADGTNFISKVSSIPSDTDVITIFGSGNDKSLNIPLGDADDDDNTTLCGYINLTLDAIFDAFPLVPLGIITPTPWKNSEPSDGNTTMAQYCEKLVQICARRGIPCLDLFHCSNLHPDDAGFREIAYSRDTDPETGEIDGVHPDENGHRFIAPRFREFLFSLI